MDNISQCEKGGLGEKEQKSSSPGDLPKIHRTKDGLFAKGNPGGPGRPKGSSAGDIVRMALAEHGDDLIAVAIEEARDKRNTKLLSDLLKFMTAGRRSTYEPVQIPGIEQAATLEEKTRCIMEAATAGTIPADVAATLLQGFERAEQAQKVEALTARLDTLTRVVEGRVLNKGYTNG